MNRLIALDIGYNNNFNILFCYYNSLKFSTLPIFTSIYSWVWYNYDPQDTIYAEPKAYTDTVDLNSEYNINGNITNFNWFDITDGTEKAIEQPTNEEGVFTFTEDHIDKRLRCKMTNAQFPDLTLVYEVEIKLTGIEDEDEIDFTISPNPASTQLTITHSSKELHEISSILLYDVSGKLLKTYTVEEPTTVLDISDLDNGIYFLTVDGKSVKFIKE
jgi:hypothetical protein